MQRRLCLLNLVRCSRILKINEAVIKMIIKGRSPTMRHVSRTHRVALDWLFDSIMIQIKYVDTKKQLTDILTKGTFSSASCPKAMSKRMQQGTGEERVVAKSKPTLNLVSHAAASSLTAPSSNASSRPVALRAPGQQGSNLKAQSAGKPAGGGSNQHDAASSSQVWLTDAKMSQRARRLAAAGTNQYPSFQERARKRAAENSDINDEDDTKCRTISAYLVPFVPHLERVYSNLRQQLKRKAEDKMEDLDVKTLIWRIFVSVTQQAAVHLGNDYLDNLHSTKNQPQRTAKQLFGVRRKLVKEKKNQGFFHDQLAGKLLKKDDSVD